MWGIPEKYYPRERYMLTTKLGEDEVMKRLMQSIEPEQFFRLRFKIYFGPSYEGTVWDKAFGMRPIAPRQGFFRFTVRGVVTTTPDGTKITVRAEQPRATVVFACVWLGAMLIGLATSFGYFLKTIRHLEPKSFMFILPLIMLLFGAALFTGNYYTDRADARTFLIDLLEINEVQDLEWTKI